MEADLRLAAADELVVRGRRDAEEEQVAKALAFYRSVDATFFVNCAERLLAVPAAQSESA